MFEVEAGADEKQQIKFVWPYIADMRTKEVSKCTETSERNIFSSNHLLIPLVSVFWGSGVVGGIRGK